MTEDWIKVNTSEGLFSTESNVSVLLADGQNISFFVDKSLLKVDNGHSLLRVTFIKNIPDENKKLVLLPTEPLESYSSRWAEVPA